MAGNITGPCITAAQLLRRYHSAEAEVTEDLYCRFWCWYSQNTPKGGVRIREEFCTVLLKWSEDAWSS